MIMKFKESSLLKKHKQLLGNKRDKRKKVVKSTSPTPNLKKAVIKKQEGGTLFSIYNSIDPYIPPTIDFNAPELETEIVTNPIKKRQAKVIEEAKKSTANSEVQELKEINSEIPSKKIPKSSETWKSPYSNKNEWVSDLTNAYKKAGITNDNAIRMLISQDALESGWGRSAQGKFNFGNLTTGSSWKGAYVEGKDHDAKGNPIKQRFRAYDSMDEYAADKIQFLKRLYDFDENDDIDKFISKLSGANKGKRRYAEATNYATSLANVYNKFAEGGIIKAQNGSKSEELLVKKALEFGQKTSEKMSPYDVRLIDFIKSKEGFRPKPERDKTDGKWTVGYGLTDPKLIRKYRNGITEEEASKHLIQHLQMGADSLVTMPYYDNLNLGEKTALNDLIYNIGWNKFKNSKRLQSHLKAGNDAGAKKEMNHGEHQARGLKIRRNQNRQMYDSTFSWKYEKGGVVKYQEPAQGIQKLSQEAIADSLNYGWEGQNNFSERQSRYLNVDPTGNFYSLSDWASNGWRTMWSLDRANRGTPHEEALYFRYLGGKRDATQLPQTPIRFSRDYDITDNVYPNKEYTGLPKEQKDAIRNKVIPNMRSELKEGVWAQVKDDVRRNKDQRGTGDALSGMGKFGLRNNNNSGIFDVVDTYDYPSWVPIPDRNKGYELEIRDTIWTKDARPELYKVENGYLPYNANPLQKWAKKEIDQLIKRSK